MFRVIRNIAAFGLLSAMVTGCSLVGDTNLVGQLGNLTLNTNNTACDSFLTTDKSRVDPEKIAPVINELVNPFGGDNSIESASYNALLDCVLGTTEKGNSKEARSKRLFRAHVIVTLISRYAAFNISGEVGGLRNVDFQSYDEVGEDASTILSRLEVVQDLLRIAAYGNDPKTFAAFKRETSKSITAVKLTNLNHLHRVNLRFLELAVLQLVLDAEKPSYRRARIAVKSIITAVVSQNPANAKGALKFAVAGLKKAAVLNRFATAYMGDAMDFVQSEGANFTWKKTPGPDDWAKWDALLIEACDRLADVGQVKNHCLKDDEMTAARALLNGN